MKLKPWLSCFLFALIILISCQKEVGFDTWNPPDPNPLVGDSNYMDKIYWGDFIGSSTILDTQAIMTFYYDSQKRLDSFVLDDIGTSMYGDRKHSFFYSGLDSLPYKSVLTHYIVPTTFTEIHFNYYNANKVKIKDSMIYIVTSPSAYYTDTVVTKFSYTGSLKIADATDGYLDSMQLDASGNVLWSKKYTRYGSVIDLESITQFTYDSHKTPFQKIKAFKSYNNIPMGETQWFDYFPNNEILSIIEVVNGMPGTNYTTQNTYYTTGAGAGLIKQTIMTGTGFPDTEVLQFTYKKL